MNENIQKAVLIILLISLVLVYDYWDKTHCRDVSIYYKCNNYLN